MKDRFEDVAVQVKVLDAIDALERERDPKKRADHKARIDALLNPPGPEADRETDARAGAIAAAVAVPSVPPDHPDHDLRFRQRFAALVEGWPIRRVAEAAPARPARAVERRSAGGGWLRRLASYAADAVGRASLA